MSLKGQTRGPGYYRGQLRRAAQRFRGGSIGAELLAREVERFLHETERGNVNTR